MNQVRDFYNHDKKIKEIFRQQDIIKEYIKKIDKLCCKKFTLEYSIREFCYAYEFFLNNKYINTELTREFNKNIKNFLYKFKRCEIINTIFSYNHLINKIMTEIQSFYDTDEESMVKTLNPELIFIKPLINFQKDSMKIRFIIIEESLEEKKLRSKEINDSNFNKKKLKDKESSFTLYEAMNNCNITENENLEYERECLIDLNLNKEENKKEKSDFLLDILEPLKKEELENKIKILEKQKNKNELYKFEVKKKFRKIINSIINQEENENNLKEFFDIKFDENQLILYLKSKTRNFIKKSNEKLDKIIYNLNIEFKSYIKFDIDGLKFLYNIKKESFLNLENQIKNHLILCKRNTKKLKKTFLKFENLILTKKKDNPIFSKINQILPFGSFTQFSFNKKSDLEITIITEYLQIFNEIDQMKYDKTNLNKDLIDNYNNNKDNKDKDKDNNPRGEKFYQTIKEYNNFLYSLKSILEESNLYFKINVHRTKRVKIFEMYDKETLVKIEMIIDNILPLYNSCLIRNYCLYDSRVIIMINFIKDWSKLSKVNGNNNGNLSSYCFTMLVIYFLQRINPKVLPILQSKDLFDFKDINFYESNHDSKNKKDIINCRQLFLNFDLNINEEDSKSNFIDYTNNKVSRGFLLRKNIMGVSELIYNFFKFYLFYFDERMYCIDIQHKEYIYRSYENCSDNDLKSQYVIIDPIDFSYNPAAYLEYNSYSSNNLKKEFFRAILNIIDSNDIIKNNDNELIEEKLNEDNETW
jgi:hypothetical protein